MSQPCFPPPPAAAAKQTILVSSTAEPTAKDLQLKARQRILNAIRTGIVALSVAMAFIVLVISARTLYVYNNTHVSPELHLPLWPEAFDIRPTVSLVACSTLVFLFGAVSLAGQFLRNDTVMYKVAIIGGPIIGFISALIPMAHFYGVNSSESVDTLMSWSCRWRHVPTAQEPHFGPLCEQSKAGLVSVIVLVPLQLLVTGMAIYQVMLDKRLAQKTVFLTLRRTDTPESMFSKV